MERDSHDRDGSDGSGNGTLYSIANGRAPWTTLLPIARYLVDDRRDCLPSGHALSWEILTAGTILEGDAYIDWYVPPTGRSTEH